jgi:hypothetical protein
MNSSELTVIVVGAIAVLVALAAIAGRGRSASPRRSSERAATSGRNAADVAPGVFAADSVIHHHKHDSHHGGHHHDSASAGHTAHVGHDAGGHAFDGGHSGFDGGHGGFDGGGGDAGGSH